MIRTQGFRTFSQLTLAGAALALGTVAVQAQTPAPTEPAMQQPAPVGMNPAELFAKADANGDAKLSREEAQAVPGLSDKFDAVDGDKDGALSQSEFSAALAK